MSFTRKTIQCFVVAVAITVTACGNLVYHRVQEGETLYSIGFRYGQDYRRIAEWNDLRPPYHISEGQRLRVAPPTELTEHISRRQGEAPRPPVAAAPSTPRQSAPSSARRPAPVTPAPGAPAPRWVVPADGRILRAYSTGDRGNKGVDIGGQFGQPVRAAAAGKVVYSGDGLINYGNLVIIKHDDRYLSAYGHNNRLRVSEGEQVATGQHIADMGRSTDGTVMLHFEIRYDGKPVDPRRHIPALK